MEIIPAIIPKSFEDLEQKLRKVKGFAPLVQIDITDGRFVPEASWPYSGETEWEEFEKIASGEAKLSFWKEFDFEADLMIQSPEMTIDQWVRAGFSRIIVHFESTSELAAVLDELEGRVEIGLALAIDTPSDEIEAFVSKVDFLQCMGIAEIGFQGQPFDDRVIPKIEELKSLYPDVTISVDGGVSLESAKLLRDAGAQRVVSGSAVFDSDDIKKSISDFEKL